MEVLRPHLRQVRHDNAKFAAILFVHLSGKQESGHVYLSPKYKQSHITMSLYKFTADITHNNFISENGKTQKTIKSTQKRDGRLQL